eukprot:CAMPEP_0197446972 /NCGR_PEP_ID=MMETSP1175-20131217/11751_1 /TAXON_ID=1003142 /ORGANISM="Triceratium dubium, Strain CCMP147" /LENGTH=499 /DNA_ID=CAMNT_0042978149 /DNA_START=137 /DNA_END=1636 /DNA_ORIENTATION=-
MNPSSIRIERVMSRGLDTPHGCSALNAAPSSRILDQIQAPAFGSGGQHHQQSVIPLNEQASPSPASSTDRGEKPTRPLSAYNLFFRYERAQLLLESQDKTSADTADAAEGKKDGDKETPLAPRPTPNIEDVRYILKNNPFHVDNKNRVHSRTHGKIGFLDLVKHISARWKSADPATRDIFKRLATEDRDRYKRESVAYNMRLNRRSFSSGDANSAGGGKYGQQQHVYQHHQHAPFMQHHPAGIHHQAPSRHHQAPANAAPMFNPQAHIAAQQSLYHQSLKSHVVMGHGTGGMGGSTYSSDSHHPQKIVVNNKQDAYCGGGAAANKQDVFCRGITAKPHAQSSSKLKALVNHQGGGLSIMDRLCGAQPNKDPLSMVAPPAARAPPAGDGNDASPDNDAVSVPSSMLPQQQEKEVEVVEVDQDRPSNEPAAVAASSPASPPPPCPEAEGVQPLPLDLVRRKRQGGNEEEAAEGSDFAPKKRRKLDVSLLDFLTTLDWDKFE